MFKWGAEESHSSLLGCWDDLARAEKETSVAVRDEDGKYDAVIFECELNKTNKKPICTYRGIGFFDRIEGYHIYHSSVWTRLLEAWKDKT